jgi:hypothetical protein
MLYHFIRYPKLRAKTMFFIIFLSHFFSVVFSQTLIKGKVLCNGKTVKGAKISALSTKDLFNPIESNKAGGFEIEVKGSGDQLTISKKGYLTKNIMLNTTNTITVNLEKNPNAKSSRSSKRSIKYCCPNCCFSSGTKICLVNGLEKNIESIKPGDQILNVNLANFSLQTDKVTQIDSVIHNNLIVIELENKTTIKSTNDHPYFVKDKGWCAVNFKSTFTNYGINARVLKAGDKLTVYANGQLQQVVIKSIKHIKESIMTYNISGLSQQANYFANGILVSNENENGKLSTK